MRIPNWMTAAAGIIYGLTILFACAFLVVQVQRLFGWMP